MARILTLLLFAAVLLAGAVGADPLPAKGQLLVATELVGGDVFGHTVILLLHYDDTGAAGLVVNRPTEVETTELFPDDNPIAAYEGPIYWGGPVQMNSLMALMDTDAPPDGAEKILDSVYVVPLNEELSGGPGVRVYIGYAGWSPGQLDVELARGSWDVMPATKDLVFAKKPALLWQELAPRREFHAAVHPKAAWL